jgi:acyl-CoA thioesterase I
MVLTSLRYAIIIIIAVSLACPASIVLAFAEERECAVPERFASSEPPLSKTPRALAKRREVLIVALGGASTVGLAAGKAELAWPSRLASALNDRFSSEGIKVVNLSVARQTAETAAKRLDRDVLPLKPTLVIWETGTMEAVRGIDVDQFRETLQAGINKLHAADIELVLMNMQFSRDTDAMIHFSPYLAAMREIAASNGVPLFRRHGIMRYWAESGSLDLRVRGGEQRRQVAAKLYDCIGHAMADFVTRDMPAAKPVIKLESGG